MNTLKNYLFEIFPKQEFKILSYIFILALFLRVFFVLETTGTPFYENLFSDSQIYNNWAVELATEGNWIGDEAFFMAPAYPYIMGIIYSVFGESVLLLRILQVILSSLMIFPVFLATKNLFSTKEGYIAAVFTALHSVFIFYSGTILSETIQIFVLTIILLFLSSKKEKTKWTFMKLGLLIGLAALFRATILVFAVFMILYYAYNIYSKVKDKQVSAKHLLFFLIGLAIPILPVTVRNYAVADNFVLLTANGGINLYIGNNDKAEGVFKAPKEFDFYSDLSGKNYAEKRLGKSLSASEASAYWRDKALDYILSNPVDFVLLEAKKFFLLFGEQENPQSSIMDYEYFAKNYSRILRLPLIGFLFISMFGIAGFILFKKKLFENKPLFLFLLSTVLTLLLFFVNGRFRMSLTPILIIFASAALLNIINIIMSNEFSKLKNVSAVLLIFILSYYFVIDLPEFNSYDADSFLGEIAMEEKNYDEAVTHFNNSLMKYDYYMTYVNLANALALKQDFNNALRLYDEAIKKNGDYVQAYFNKGLALTQKGDLQDALRLYDKVIQLDENHEGAYRNMGIIFYVTENYENALLYFEKYLELSTDEEIKASVQYDVDVIKKKLELNESNEEN